MQSDLLRRQFYAAIEKKIAGPDNGKLYTEDDWNNEATIDKYPYHLSKVVRSP